ncbi:MAG: hypothetical protein H8E27_14085 [Verrucomicrobia subdivision 3 bacterium]|nr:hypothetical protein [Limisphaerales bacterium]
MKKSLLTLVALIGFTWNLSAQELPVPNDTSGDNYYEDLSTGELEVLAGMGFLLPNDEGEWFIDFGFGNIALQALPFFWEMVNDPVSVFKFIMDSTGVEGIGLQFVPYNSVFHNGLGFVHVRLGALATDIFIEKDNNHPDGLMIDISHAPVGIMHPYILIMEYYYHLEITHQNGGAIFSTEPLLAEYEWTNFGRLENGPFVPDKFLHLNLPEATGKMENYFSFHKDVLDVLTNIYYIDLVLLAWEVDPRCIGE